MFRHLDRARRRASLHRHGRRLPRAPSPETAPNGGIIGKWLQGQAPTFVLATKMPYQVGESDNDEGLSAVHIMRAVEASLRR